MDGLGPKWCGCKCNMTSCAPEASAVGWRVNESLFCKSCCPVPPSRSHLCFSHAWCPLLFSNMPGHIHTVSLFTPRVNLQHWVLLQQAFKIETMHHYEPLHTSCDEATFILLCMLNFLFSQQKKSLTYFWVICLEPAFKIPTSQKIEEKIK